MLDSTNVDFTLMKVCSLWHYSNKRRRSLRLGIRLGLGSGLGCADGSEVDKGRCKQLMLIGWWHSPGVP